MGMTPEETANAPQKRSSNVLARLLGGARLHYRSGVALVGMLLLVVVVTMPFTLSSTWDEMTGPPEGEVFHIGPPAAFAANAMNARLHIAMVAFDELPRLATLRVTWQYVCPAPCTVRDRLRLFSLSENE